MSISDVIRTVHFLSKDGKAASYEARDGWKSCLFPARVGTHTFDAIIFDSTFPYLYLDFACKKLCFPPAKGVNRGNESTTSELFRTFERTIKNLFENFQNFFEFLETFIETLSELVYNCY